MKMFNPDTKKLFYDSNIYLQMKMRNSYFNILNNFKINFLIILCLFSLKVYGEEKTSETLINSTKSISQAIEKDSINIRAIVQAQIDSAIVRNTRGEIRSYSSIFVPISNKTTAISTKKKIKVEESEINKVLDFLLKEVNRKILFIASFSLILFLIVFIRRFSKKYWFSLFKIKIRSTKNSKEEVLHDKIISLNEELDTNINNPGLNLIRSKLVNLSAPDILSNSISGKAKELKIAKGEIILAAKIKSFELAQLSSSK